VYKRQPLHMTQTTLIWFRAAPKIEMIFIPSNIMTTYICQCGQKAELYCDACCETTCEVCWFGNLHASHTTSSTPCIECGELSVFDCERCEASFCTNHAITHRSFQTCTTCGKITCEEMMAENSPDCFHCDWLKKYRAMITRR
jgi:hypothetical protein